MKCRKLFLYFASCLLFVSVFTSFTLSPNTSALSDITRTYNSSSNGLSKTLCYPLNLGSGKTQCRDYMYVTFSGTCSNTSFSINYMYSPSNIITVSTFRFSFNSFLLLSTFETVNDTGHYTVDFLSDTFSDDCSVSILMTDSNPFSGGPSPSGSITLTENGTFDVSSYAEAVVDVPAEVIYGDYHDDLVSINNSIVIGCAVPLVIYFFYAIYKMLLGGSKG